MTLPSDLTPRVHASQEEVFQQEALVHEHPPGYIPSAAAQAAAAHATTAASAPHAAAASPAAAHAPPAAPAAPAVHTAASYRAAGQCASRRSAAADAVVARASQRVSRQQGQLPSSKPATAAKSPAAAAADMWAFGCLVAYLGTGEAPYDEEVHERASTAVHGLERPSKAFHERAHSSPVASSLENGEQPTPESAVYSVLEWAVQQGRSPLARLPLAHAASAPTLSEVRPIAEACVQREPAQRPLAVEVLAQLPRETAGLFGVEREGGLHASNARRARMSRAGGHHGHHHGGGTPSQQQQHPPRERLGNRGRGGGVGALPTPTPRALPPPGQLAAGAPPGRVRV